MRVDPLAHSVRHRIADSGYHDQVASSVVEVFRRFVTNVSIVSRPRASTPWDTVNAPRWPASMARRRGSRMVLEGGVEDRRPLVGANRIFEQRSTWRNCGTPYLIRVVPSGIHSLFAATPAMRCRSRRSPPARRLPTELRCARSTTRSIGASLYALLRRELLGGLAPEVQAVHLIHVRRSALRCDGEMCSVRTVRGAGRGTRAGFEKK